MRWYCSRCRHASEPLARKLRRVSSPLLGLVFRLNSGLGASSGLIDAMTHGVSGSKLKERARNAGEFGAEDNGVDGEEKALETEERDDLEEDRDEVVQAELVRETGDGRCLWWWLAVALAMLA